MLLKKGNNNDKEAVKKVQKVVGVTADGIYGPKTEAAVKAWQKSHNLDDDGIVGPKTWAAMFPEQKETNSKCVDPSVVYMPLSVHVTKSAGRKIKYLAIHYTAGGSSAKGRARNIKNVFEKRKASADFAVDDAEMVQFNPDIKNYYCWAVGDTKASKVNCPDGRNSNTISIEICSNLKKGTSVEKANHEGWYYSEASLENAAKLAKILMKKYDIPIENVVRHYDISGKLCPGIIGWNDGPLYKTDGTKTNQKNNSEKWLEFKKRLK